MSARVAIANNDIITLNDVELHYLTRYIVRYEKAKNLLYIDVIEQFERGEESNSSFTKQMFDYAMNKDAIYFIHKSKEGKVINKITGRVLALEQDYGVDCIIVLRLIVEVYICTRGNVQYLNKEMRQWGGGM